MSFAEILKDVMIDKNLNQTTLAQKVGVTQGQVSEWLSEVSKPGYDSLKLICKGLDVSADYLLGLSDNM